jgi:TonB-linked SusC/RagA family outer membrane protein
MQKTLLTIDVLKRINAKAFLPVLIGGVLSGTAYANHVPEVPSSGIHMGTVKFDRTIEGKITDQAGEGLPGVNVRVEGTTQGAISDIDGNFKISVSDGNVTLIVSFVGFLDQRVVVSPSQSRLNIVLQEDSKVMDEVVVVGYGTQKRSDITGSVASVPKERLSQLPVTNVMQAVQGSVAGVTVTQGSSVPGAQPGTLVRGQNSINAGTGPFVVVDGIPLSKTGGSLNDINPNDIESMEILKDASAVAIYGTNGANGVILITTKRGTTGKPTIRYNNYAGIEEFANVLTPRNGQQYVQKYADWMSQTGQTQTQPVPNFGELENYNAGIETNWLDVATRTGFIQDHNLSISGGTQNVKYFLSGGLMDQKGVVEGYSYKRASLRSNLDADLTNYLTVGTSLFIVNNDYGNGRANLLNATAMSPYGQVYNENGTYKTHPMFPEELFLNPMLGLTEDRADKNTNINGNAYAEVKFKGILQGLKFRVNGGYSFLPARRGSYKGRAAYDLNGTATTFYSETNSYVVENILSWAKDFGKHHLDFTGLYSAQQRKYVQSEARAVGFVNDELSYHNLGAGATQSSGSYADKYALNSQMGRINYSYDSRYLFTFTTRRDGSSVFGANTSKYGIFPSVAIGWNIANESFMQDLKSVSNLKLRLSVGESGNEAISVYRTITTNGTNRFPFNGVSTIGALASNLGNANLQWETTLSKNVGLDFGFFGNRINGTLDVYQNNSKGLLLLRNLPIITGYFNVYDNLGETQNNGVELTLNTKNYRKNDFAWESTVIFSANKNKIVDLYGDKQDDIGNRWFIGKPISVVYDYKMAGVWQVGEDAASVDAGARPGDLKFEDINGDGRITPDGDRVVLGQTAPKWTGGFTNTLTYKNWSMNIFIQTVQGITRNNADLTYADETGRRNTPIDVGYWTAENQSQTRPSLAFRNPRGYGYASDASYTRLKDVTLSYRFNEATLERLGLGSLNVFASGRNLYTFTNWIGWDPEAVQSQRGSGDWSNNYPLTRSYVLGLNVTLR